MDRDRTACLIARAAGRNLIDFSQLRQNASSWRRLRMTLRELETADIVQLRGYLLQVQLAQLSRPDLAPDQQKAILKKINALTDQLAASLRPWQFFEGHREEAEKSEAIKLRSSWEGRYGKMSDPAVQEKLRLVAELMLAQNADIPQPTALSQAGIFNRNTAQLLSHKPRV